MRAGLKVKPVFFGRKVTSRPRNLDGTLDLYRKIVKFIYRIGVRRLVIDTVENCTS